MPVGARRWLEAACVLAAASSLLACRPDRATSSPAGAGAAATDPKAAIALAYRPARLRARVAVELTTNGGGRYLETAANLETALELSAKGDRLEVGWALQEVGDVTLQGTIPRGDADLGAYLVAHGRGTWVLDATGAEDIAGTEAHPSNAPRRQRLEVERARLADARASGAAADPDPAVTLLELLPPLLLPPRLPGRALAVGETVEDRSSSELELPALQLVLPIDTTSKTTLIGVDDAGKTRIAELQLDVLRYGGLDTEAGPVELEEHLEGTLLFDVDHGVPVRFELTTTSSFTAGERGGDSTAIVRAEIERN